MWFTWNQTCPVIDLKVQTLWINNPTCMCITVSRNFHKKSFLETWNREEWCDWKTETEQYKIKSQWNVSLQFRAMYVCLTVVPAVPAQCSPALSSLSGSVAEVHLVRLLIFYSLSPCSWAEIPATSPTPQDTPWTRNQYILPHTWNINLIAHLLLL